MTTLQENTGQGVPVGREAGGKETSGKELVKCGADGRQPDRPQSNGVAELPHRIQAPSPWVSRWLRLLPPASQVLDLACGSGRHSRLAHDAGHRVVAVDRDGQALAGLASLPGVKTVQADIESGDWPLPGQRFDAVIVTNYLYRPLFPVLLDSITEAGLLVYETFAQGNERFGRPANPDFLLRPGELYETVRPALRVLAYEDVFQDSPRPAMVQRLCACGNGFSWPVRLVTPPGNR